MFRQNCSVASIQALKNRIIRFIKYNNKTQYLDLKIFWILDIVFSFFICYNKTRSGKILGWPSRTRPSGCAWFCEPGVFEARGAYPRQNDTVQTAERYPLESEQTTRDKGYGERSYGIGMIKVVKRDGEIADFTLSKITEAIKKAFKATKKE